MNYLVFLVLSIASTSGARKIGLGVTHRSVTGVIDFEASYGRTTSSEGILSKGIMIKPE
jgi:hypothetical protein